MIPGRAIAFLDYVFQLALLAVLAGVLTAALVLQFGAGELPCPLCLLERLCMFGVAFGVILNLRAGFSDRNTGIALTFALLLLVIAVRQTLLDIYPRPGHAYVGSAVLGLHMPVWSVLIATAVIAAYALKLAVLGGDGHRLDHPPASFAWVRPLGLALSVAILGLCAVNLGAVVLQCGLAECHTEGYRLLGGPVPAGG